MLQARTAIKPSWPEQRVLRAGGGAGWRNKAGSGVSGLISEMTKSFYRVCFGKEKRLQKKKKKSLNGKFKETETKASLGFQMGSVTVGEWYFLWKALDHSKALSSLSSQSYFHIQESESRCPWALPALSEAMVGLWLMGWHQKWAPQVDSAWFVFVFFKVPDTSGCSLGICGTHGVAT